MRILRDKVVAITGAGSGIGRALAGALIARGAVVAMSDIDEASLRDAVRGWPGARVSTQVVDVRVRAAMEQWARDCETRHGGVDVIINNAGVAARASLEDMSYEHLALVIDVNLWGVIHGIKCFLPLLRKRPEGHIVNMSSINALVPFAKNGPYNAAKAAVLGLSETLMQELQDEPIRVSCVHPGLVKTRIAHNSPGVVLEDAEFFDRRTRTSAERAAEVILRGVERDRERIYVGIDAWLLAGAKRVAPALTVRLTGRASRSPTGR